MRTNHGASSKYRLLDTLPSRPTAAPGASVRVQPEKPRSRNICCVACHTPVTDADFRIDVGGRHEHTFFNPAGVVFHIVVFAAAPGCRGVGPFSEEFTWFPGHRWQIAVCAACAEHLGWHFEGASQFTALIAQRIADCPDASDS
jgi:hypothetical protein